MTNMQSHGESDPAEEDDSMDQSSQQEQPVDNRDVEPQDRPRPDNDGETVPE